MILMITNEAFVQCEELRRRLFSPKYHSILAIHSNPQQQVSMFDLCILCDAVHMTKNIILRVSFPVDLRFFWGRFLFGSDPESITKQLA